MHIHMKDKPMYADASLYLSHVFTGSTTNRQVILAMAAQCLQKGNCNQDRGVVSCPMYTHISFCTSVALLPVHAAILVISFCCLFCLLLWKYLIFNCLGKYPGLTVPLPHNRAKHAHAIRAMSSGTAILKACWKPSGMLGTMSALPLFLVKLLAAIMAGSPWHAQAHSRSHHRAVIKCVFGTIRKLSHLCKGVKPLQFIVPVSVLNRLLLNTSVHYLHAVQYYNIGIQLSMYS